jgi:hypothetical protein
MWFERKATILALIRKWNIVFTKVCVKFLILNFEAFNFRYNISFIDPPLGGFGEILPSVMIFPSGQSPSGNISPNPPLSRSINDKCSTFSAFAVHEENWLLLTVEAKFFSRSLIYPCCPCTNSFRAKFFVFRQRKRPWNQVFMSAKNRRVTQNDIYCLVEIYSFVSLNVILKLESE